jgi:hypothetical protein
MDTQPTQMQITIANHFKFDCMLLENFDDERPSQYDSGSGACQKWVCAEVTDFRSGRGAWHIVEIKSPVPEWALETARFSIDYDSWYVKLVTSRLESALECAMDLEENIVAE